MKMLKHGQTRSMFVPAAFRELVMTDIRNGLDVGNIRTLCDQHGVSMTREGDFLKLSAPRDRLQSVLEMVHYSNIPYAIGDKAPKTPAKRGGK